MERVDGGRRAAPEAVVTVSVFATLISIARGDFHGEPVQYYILNNRAFVKIVKTVRYRVYPTDAQVARLGRWEDALRFLWNLANEQRWMGVARPNGEKRYPTAFDQMKEMTELRAVLPWLADVPRNVCSQLLVDLDASWRSFFSKLTRAPRWKRKGGRTLRVCEPHPSVWRVDASSVRFPKLGTMRAVVHRPLEGSGKTCTLKRDADQWFVMIACDVGWQEPARRNDPLVAIDRGIVNAVADSDGRIVESPRHFERAIKRLGRAQRAISRKKKGSKNRLKAKARVATLHRKVRRQRAHFIHNLSAGYAKSHGCVVVEKLQIENMVKVGGGLARGIMCAGWGLFVRQLRYKMAWSGGSIIEVQAAYSSQTCSACGCVDAASRKSQASFVCTSCGHSENADLNAAKVLLARANRSGKPVDGSLPEGSGRSRKRIGLRFPRRPVEAVAV